MRGTWDLQAARRVLQRQLLARAAHISQLEEDVREAVGKANDVCGGAPPGGLQSMECSSCLRCPVAALLSSLRMP
jgi:hypothetical protein